MDQLPVLKKVYKWFKGDGLNIDSPLFKLHHHVSTLVLVIGFIYISVENHLDESILCQSPPSISQYAKSYCWIHGTAYLRQHLQGKATGCFVDQSKISSEEDAPVTAYYLWLPYLLTFCLLFAKFPHSMWKRFFENGLLQNILGGGQGHRGGGGGNNMSHWGGGGNNQSQWGNDMTMMAVSAWQSNTHGGGGGGGGGGGKGKNKNQRNQGGNQNNKAATIAQNFIDFRLRYNKYHKKFVFFESLNIPMIVLSFYLTHWLLNYQFMDYGIEVAEYIGSVKRVGPRGEQLTHNPMCELFPTEVACTFRVGASTGGIDRSNFLCILGNNLFNQKYFFILWLWWAFLILLSIAGVIYRLATMSIPSFAKSRMARKVHGGYLRDIRLSSAECFVLGMVLDNMSSRLMGPNVQDQMLEELESLYKLKKKEEMDSVDNVATPQHKPYYNFNNMTKPNLTNLVEHSGLHQSEISLTESDTIVNLPAPTGPHSGHPNGYIPNTPAPTGPNGAHPNGYIPNTSTPSAPATNV